MTSLASCELLIRRMARLGFRDAESRVIPFLQRRAEYFGVSRVRVVDDFAEASASTPAFTIAVTATNPFIDFDVVGAMCDKLASTGARRAVASGAVPGTQPDFVINPRATREEIVRVTVATQQRFNNQVNLYKYKRLKMFLALEERFPELHTLAIPQLMELLDAQHSFLVGYATGAAMQRHTTCPSCKSSSLSDLVGSASQPLIGYVRSERAIYKRCDDCELGFMTPYVNPLETERLYDEFDYQDAATTEEELRRSQLSQKLTIAIDMLDAALRNPRVKALDLGGGSGVYSFHLKRRHPEWNVIHSDFDGRRQEFLRNAGIEVAKLNFITEEIQHHELDVITAFEVIEHVDLASFEALVKKVRGALKVGGYLLLSTPDLDSPLVRAFDFYNAYAPHHLLLFSGSWLTRYFSAPERGFKIVQTKAGGDLLQDYQSYFSYYRDTAPTFQQRASAELLLTLLQDEANRNRLLDSNMGSEVIMLLQRVS